MMEWLLVYITSQSHDGVVTSIVGQSVFSTRLISAATILIHGNTCAYMYILQSQGCTHFALTGSQGSLQGIVSMSMGSVVFTSSPYYIQHL